MKNFARKCAIALIAGVMVVASATTTFGDIAGQPIHLTNPFIFNGTPSHEHEGEFFHTWEEGVKQDLAGMGVFSTEQLEHINSGRMFEGATWVNLTAPVKVEILASRVDSLRIETQTAAQRAGLEIDATPYITSGYDEQGVRWEEELDYVVGIIITQPGLYTLTSISQYTGQWTGFIIEVVGGEPNQATPTPTPAPTPAPSPTPTTISATVNGQPVNFADQQPINVNDRVLVPARGVFEMLGFTPTWNNDTRQATLTRANATIVITIDSTTFTTNGTSHTLDVPAQIINGRTMLPLRAVLESVGYELEWDGATQTVIITSAG